MISNKENLPFNFLFDNDTYEEVIIIIYKKCFIKYGQELANSHTTDILKNLKFYIDRHFSIVSFFSDPKYQTPERNDISIKTFFTHHPLLNEDGYETFIKIVDCFINKEVTYPRELLKLYQTLFKRSLTEYLTYIKNSTLEDTKDFEIDEIINFLSHELLDLRLNPDSNTEIINLYSALIEFYKSQKLLTKKKNTKNSLTDNQSFEDLIALNYKDHSTKILSLLYDSTPPIVDEHNHWIGEQQAAYVFYDCLKAQLIITCTLETFKSVLQKEFKNFNPSGVKKPTTTARAYDYKKDFIARLKELK